LPLLDFIRDVHVAFLVHYPKSGDGMSRKDAKKKQMQTSRHSPAG
jgi:hypothetical protein